MSTIIPNSKTDVRRAAEAAADANSEYLAENGSEPLTRTERLVYISGFASGVLHALRSELGAK